MIAHSTNANQANADNAARALLHTVEFLDDDYHKLVTVRRANEVNANNEM
jgi:hypothetical protein